MKKILVKITLEVPVEIPEDEDYDEVFDIEENHCPATGLVGMALEKIMDKHNADSSCWACALNGKNEIIEEK